MPTFTLAISLIALAAQALSFAIQNIPTPSSSTSGFSVQQVQVGKKLRSGALELRKVYLKYDVPVPTPIAVAAAAAATQTGTVVSEPELYDAAYLCPVTVGNDVLYMDFDTGSSDFWVFSSLLPVGDRRGRSFYRPTKPGAVLLNKTWDISYGDGSGAAGVVYADKVVIGGATATRQAVEAATAISSEFVQDTFIDGLNGLGFQVLNTCFPSACRTWFGTIASTLPEKLFTASLRHFDYGEYTFGYIDSAKYTSNITYTPILKQKYWTFKITGYSVGHSHHNHTMHVIADTGTTLIYLPGPVTNAYYSKVPNALYYPAVGAWLLPCSTKKMPDFSVTVEGVDFTVPGEYMNYKAPYTDTLCFGALQPSDSLGVNVLGDVFLKSLYAIFDVGNGRIGFAT